MPIDFTTTFSVLYTLGIWSILFGDNPIFRIMLMIMAGTTVGYTVTQGLDNIYFSLLTPLSKGNLTTIIPLIVGALVFFRLHNKTSWISKFPTAIFSITNIGSTVAGALVAQIWRNIIAAGTINSVDTAITSIFTIFVILNFIMTMKEESFGGFAGYILRAGRWMVLIAFSIGLAVYTVGRLSYLVARLMFITYNWLEIIPI